MVFMLVLLLVVCILVAVSLFRYATSSFGENVGG